MSSISYFIVTTPLQYANAINIEVFGNKRVLLFVGKFNGWINFFDEISINNSIWNKILLFNTPKEPYTYLKKQINRKDALYVDSDYGLKKFFWILPIRIKSSNIYVYEEGIGSYKNNLISEHANRSKLLTLFLKSIGIKEYFGGSILVKGIYVYNHTKHSLMIPNFNNKRYSFELDFVSNVDRLQFHLPNQKAFIDDLLISFKGNNVALYLTSWVYNENILDIMKVNKSHNLFIIKPHPHLVCLNEISSHFDFVIPSNIFIELFIAKLAENKISFTVYHENCSALMYFNSESFKMINIHND